MYAHRATNLNREDDIQIRLTDGSTLDAEYLDSTDAYIWVINEEGQFVLPTSNVVWVRKDLQPEGH